MGRLLNWNQLSFARAPIWSEFRGRLWRRSGLLVDRIALELRDFRGSIGEELLRFDRARGFLKATITPVSIFLGDNWI
jgi:hypothetical protein